MERVGNLLHGFRPKPLSHVPSFSRSEALTVLLIAVLQVRLVAGACYWSWFQFGMVLRLCCAFISYDIEGSGIG